MNQYLQSYVSIKHGRLGYGDDVGLLAWAQHIQGHLGQKCPFATFRGSLKVSVEPHAYLLTLVHAYTTYNVYSGCVSLVKE